MKIESPAHALDLLGGNKVVAESFWPPRRITTVTSWAVRQSIPVAVWPRLLDLAKERGVEGFTYEALVQAHTAPPQRTARKRRRAA